MIINSDDMVSVTDANKKGVSWLVSEAAEGRCVVVMKNNMPAAVVAGAQAMERLQDLESIESDLRLWAASLVRMATDTGERYSLDEVAAEFDVDLSDDPADED